MLEYRNYDDGVKFHINNGFQVIICLSGCIVSRYIYIHRGKERTNLLNWLLLTQMGTLYV